MKSRLRLPAPDAAPNEAMTQQAVDLFVQHGCLWVENAISKTTIEKLLLAYQKKYLCLTNAQLRKRDASVGDRRFMITVDIKGRFNRSAVYANDALVPILNRLLSDAMRIASFGSVVAKSGASDQPIHLDHPPLFGGVGDALPAELWPADSLPAYALTMVIPLIDLTESTGTTAIWEGTHRGKGRIDRLQTLMQRPDFSDASFPMATQGDVYLMDYRVIHGGTANVSPIDRPVLYIVYSRPWFRDGFNFKVQRPVSISKKQRQKVPSRHRHLFD